jgi:hypothetical protein
MSLGARRLRAPPINFCYNSMKFDGKNLVLAEDDTFHSPFVPQD